MGHPRLAVDGILLLDGKLVCVIRGQPPFQGMHALPGGAVELGETTEAAMAREMEEGRGYVELQRRFIVAGTAEERHETVFLGLRRRGDQWVVVELRTAR